MCQKCLTLFHSKAIQQAFPGLRTSLLLSSVSLSCHKLALSTANWYQQSLNEEGTVPGGSAQRDQLISIKIIKKESILAYRNECSRRCMHLLLFTENFWFTYSRQPCNIFCHVLFVCMYAYMYLFVYFTCQI